MLNIEPVNRSAVLQSVLLLLVILLATLIYFPGLKGPFLLDDSYNLELMNRFGGVTSFEAFRQYIFSGESGTLGRPIALLSFLLNDQYWPGDPASFKYTNLMIHLLNGLCVFVFCSQVFKLIKLEQRKAQWLAVWVMGFWLLSPLNVSTTLYVVQRMTQLSMLFSLLGLTLYIKGRVTQGFYPSLFFMCFGIGVCGLFAVLSKENGVLLLPLALLIECTLLRSVKRNLAHKAVILIGLIVPFFVFLFYMAFHVPGHLEGYALRSFSFEERVLTQSRILFIYLKQIIIPTAQGTGLIHDDFSLSGGVFSPVTTVISIAGHLILILVSVILIKKNNYPVLSFSILWFYIGHLLESSYIPLEIYFEHRNYMPMIGVLIGFAWLVNKTINSEKIAATVLMLFVVWAGALTSQSARIWSDPFKLYSVWYAEHPSSPRGATMYAYYLYANGYEAQSIDVLEQHYQERPDAIHVPIALLVMSCNKSFESPYSLSWISEKLPESSYYGSLPSMVNKLVAAYKDDCSNITKQDFHDFMERLESVGIMPPKFLVKLYMIHSEIYFDEGDLSNAMRRADEAFKLKPISIILFEQAIMLAKAGEYAVSIGYLDYAIDVEKKSKRLSGSNLEVYSNFRKKIEDKVRSNEN